jgi:hypothetical protein
MTLKLLVLAEYGSSGIWQGELRAIAMIEHEEIHLPLELSQRFNNWIEMYAARLPYPHYPLMDSSRKFDPIPLEQFNEIGRELARDLKAFMGPDVIVRYAARQRNIGEPPELID